MKGSDSMFLFELVKLTAEDYSQLKEQECKQDIDYWLDHYAFYSKKENFNSKEINKARFKLMDFVIN